MGNQSTTKIQNYPLWRKQAYSVLGGMRHQFAMNSKASQDRFA